MLKASSREKTLLRNTIQNYRQGIMEQFYVKATQQILLSLALAQHVFLIWKISRLKKTSIDHTTIFSLEKVIKFLITLLRFSQKRFYQKRVKRRSFKVTWDFWKLLFFPLHQEKLRLRCAFSPEPSDLAAKIFQRWTNTRLLSNESKVWRRPRSRIWQPVRRRKLFRRTILGYFFLIYILCFLLLLLRIW